jgi:hypothetical protein
MSQLVGGRKHFDNLDFERAVEQARRLDRYECCSRLRPCESKKQQGRSVHWLFSELAKGSICEPASR